MRNDKHRRGCICAPTPPPTGVEQVAIDYSYDPLYRLTRATYSGSLAASYAYSYDAVGNRLTQDANGTRTTYGYDSANRLTSVNGQAYTWDNNGNLTSDGLLTYSYDQANRLKQVTQGANTHTFAYNGLGDRLSQTVGITTTRYVLDPSTGSGQVPAAGLTQALPLLVTPCHSRAIQRNPPERYRCEFLMVNGEGLATPNCVLYNLSHPQD